MSSKKRRRPKKNNRIVAAITRKNGKYYYTNYKSLKNITKIKKQLKKVSNTNKISIKTSQTSPNHKKINKTTQYELLHPQLHSNNSINLQQPFIIHQVHIPHIQMPEVLDVMLHEGITIDYTDNVLYHRIATQQILQQFSKQKSTENNDTQVGKKKLNLSIPQMELKNREVQIPDIVQKMFKNIYKINLWMYGGDRQTEWHYDGHDNFLYVLQGKKIIYLAHPSSMQSNSVWSLFNNHVDPTKEADCGVTKAVVERGSCLFIPKGWWHKVYSSGTPSVAVNYWGNSIAQTLLNLSETQKSLILKLLLFQLSENYCSKLISKWDQLHQNQKEQFRRSAGHKLLEQGKWQENFNSTNRMVSK